MFDLTDRPKVWIPVYWPGLKPGADGKAEKVEHSIEIFVEILDRDELQELFVTDEGDIKAEQDFDGFKRVVSDWRGIVQGPEGNKQPVPFTDANIRKLLAFPSFPSQLTAAYISACAGRLDIREGNSDGSLGSGPAGEPNVSKPNRQSRRASKPRR